MMNVHHLKKRIRRSLLRARTWCGNEFSLGRASRGTARVLTDGCGFRFVFYPWMRGQAESLLSRRSTAGQWAAVSQLIRPDDIVFDVGAHAGRFSAFVDSLLGDRGRIYAFEPVPSSYWMLRENLALNRCTKVTAIPAAISDREGEAAMNCFAPQYSSWNTLGRPVMKTATGQRLAPTESVTIPCETLDGFCRRNGVDRIDFLKVDVEGFERAVFEGARNLLATHRIGRICFEISQDPLAGAGYTAGDVFSILRTYGYSVYDFDDTNQRFAGPIDGSSEYWANYYASTEALTGEESVRAMALAA